METHKRVLGILYIVSGSLHILIMLFLSALFSVLLPVIFEHSEVDEQWILSFIVPFIQIITVIIVILFAIPSIIGGIALLNKKKWGLILVLVLGCFKLFSFPIGTALGIYTSGCILRITSISPLPQQIDLNLTCHLIFKEK